MPPGWLVGASARSPRRGDDTPNPPGHAERMSEQGAPSVAEATGPPPTDPVPTSPRPSRWRAAAAAVLIVLGVILVPLSAVSWWVRGTLTDTDKYVSAVAPLASDPAVQATVTDQVTDRVMTRLQTLNLAQQATDELIARGIPPQFAAAVSLIAAPLRDRVESLVHQVVGQVVSSEIFADVWTGANRIVHTELIALLNGDQGALAQNES